jgi:hypothetical protein
MVRGRLTIQAGKGDHYRGIVHATSSIIREASRPCVHMKLGDRRSMAAAASRRPACVLLTPLRLATLMQQFDS